MQELNEHDVRKNIGTERKVELKEKAYETPSANKKNTIIKFGVPETCHPIK